MPAGEARYLEQSLSHYTYLVDVGSLTAARVADGLQRMGRQVRRIHFDNSTVDRTQRGLSRQRWLESLLDQVDRVHVLELDPDPPKWVDRLRKEARLRSIKFRSIWLWHPCAL